jgi:hypothetical protein
MWYWLGGLAVAVGVVAFSLCRIGAQADKDAEWWREGGR